MRTDKRIIFACFTGAALGGVVALELRYLWWLGILLGGAIGYLAYSFREVWRAGLHAWQTLLDGRSGQKAVKSALLEAARFIGIFALVVFCACSVMALSIGAAMLLVAEPTASVAGESATPISATLPIPGLVWIIAFIGVLIPAIALGICIGRSSDRKKACMKLMGCLAATPLVLPITLTVIFVSAVVPRGLGLLARVVRHTFILIHSELRLLCMTDALIGAVVGYACGNALVGGIIGAALGWANYRFVSVRWLKLGKA